MKLTFFTGKIIILAVGLTLPFGLPADEGMWQPHQLPAMSDELKAKGLEIDADSISKLTEFPMSAIISLGGCSASFVSPKGLVVTNHHCAYGSILHNSTPENNLLEDGFLAGSFSEELPASPGSRVYVTEKVTDVTGLVLASVNSKSGNDYYLAVEQTEKALIAECEDDDAHRCQVYSFHGGLEYFLIKQMEIRDVRLVYNPSVSIGKYGGDIDNWMWPRHTGDFAFYRAYVGPDGSPAEFGEDNVPYEPSSFLKVSAKGVSEGDFVMVTGYPGRTNRYRTANEVANQFEWAYPKGKVLRERLMEIIKSTAVDGSDERIKYQSLLAGLANYAKNFTSMIESYKKSSILADREDRELKLATWIGQDPKRKERYGGTLEELDQLVVEGQRHKERDLVMGYMGYTTMLPMARRLFRLANENLLKDLDREPGYQQRDLTRFRAGLERVDRRYAPTVDRAMLFEMLKRYAQLPLDERFADFDEIFAINEILDEASLNEILADAYTQSELDDLPTRLAWMNKSIDDFRESTDFFIRVAVAMYDTQMREEQKRKDLAGRFMKVRPRYMEAIIAFNRDQGVPIYADANSSLRVAVGHVKGYSPKDGLLAEPFTRLEGILAKNTGLEPFDSPQEQLELIQEKRYGDFYLKSIDSVPVNFLSTLDSTGGNSGSPTLNGRAELVGLLFDGVYESIIADWGYDPTTNRSIQVDSRYMLWVMKYLDKADRLLNEMDLVY
jgi:hypothetical protein